MLLTRSEKVGIVGLSMLGFSIIYQSIILPPIIKSQMKRKITLKQGSFMREIWGKFPFTLDSNFYFFNITNPYEVQNGASPTLQEVGPYSYYQQQEKTNQVDHEEDDTVSYTLKNTYEFNPEKSNGLTGDEVITVPNFFAIGLVNIVQRDNPTALSIIGKALESILKKPDSIFMRLKVKDILFEGFEIDCNVKDFAGLAICNEIKQSYEDFGLTLIGTNKYKCSLWGAKNNTESKASVRVNRGVKNLAKLGSVVEYNNKPNISVWNDDYCDKFEGTDGTIFHPFFDKNGQDDIVVFNTNLCKSVSCHFVTKKKYSGLDALRYTTDLGNDGNSDPRHKCYCWDPNKCPKKGVFDIYKCLHIPLMISNPHFYLADPFYTETIRGMKPEKEKHEIVIDIEPFTGVPLHAQTKAQMNMFIMKLDKIDLMKKLPDVLLPLFWYEEVMVLPDFLLKKLKTGLMIKNLGVMLKNFLNYGGIVLVCFGVVLHYQSLQVENQRSNKQKRTHVQTLSENNVKIAEKMEISTLRPVTFVKPRSIG